jgi:D-serine deaminase-like pyridoxal phosphate-dependent protein
MAESSEPNLGIPKGEIDTPALLIDLDALEANIVTMADFCRQAGVAVRPHIKTHKTSAIARMQLDAGALGLTCAKLGEAEVMVDEADARDVLIANQIVGPIKIARLIRLAHKADLMVAVDDATNVAQLGAAARAEGVALRVLVEVDIGMGRCGVRPGEPALALARRVAETEGLRFAGLMGYEGHLVTLADEAERADKVRAAFGPLIETKQRLEADGLPVGIVSGAGTGTYALTGRIPGVTEIQAGSYVLMDRTYSQVEGLPFHQALMLLTTVISRPTPDRAVVDAGRKSITVDLGLPQPRNWPALEVVHLSEEHGKLRLAKPGKEPKIGDKLELVPSHVCTTVNLHDTFYALRSDTVEAIWPIAARGKFK